MTLLFNPDRALYGTAQLTGFAGILLTLYLANLGVEVVLRRRFQIAGMLAPAGRLADFINSSGSREPLAGAGPYGTVSSGEAGWCCARASRHLAARRLTSR